MDTKDWYKDAIIYQVHVKSFFDSNADGIGDFKGLTKKLDYIKFLGANTIWLLPFYPSPLKDDGYDIADYMAVNPIYGTLNDLKRLIYEAHKRDIRIITELVINHTSNQHHWFKKSRTAKKNSYWRNYYIWSDTPEKYQDARIIFKDFETSNWEWDSIANAYYFHRFYSHQPDLNYDNPNVQREIYKVIDFWMRLGIDGMRLDAIPYLFKREETNCENLAETHQFLKRLRHYVDQHYQNKMLLAEANQWPEEAAAYFGSGDECSMAFHFPIMPRMYMAIQMEDQLPLIDILQQTPDIPDSCQWATFLRNHDELTLEMVTDEERDYMYRMYASDPQMRLNLGIRRRLAPLLQGDMRKIQLMTALLFSLPGTPVIYYGDEIGMGDNIYLADRNGVRTPMQWSSDKNAGFSTSTPQQLYLPVVIDPIFNYESINVELQLKNPQSLLWWMKQLIDMRRKHLAFSRGSIEFLTTGNQKILAFIRKFETQCILIVVNLSHTVQHAEINLSSYNNYRLVELFSSNVFPAITESPYFLICHPYSFLWFNIINKKATDDLYPIISNQIISIDKRWTTLFDDPSLPDMQILLAKYFYQARWFKSKSKKIKSMEIADKLLLSKVPEILGLIIKVNLFNTESEWYFLPISCITNEAFLALNINHTKTFIANLQINNKIYALIDAIHDPNLIHWLTRLADKKKFSTELFGQIYLNKKKSINPFSSEKIKNINICPIQSEQSNTSIKLDDMYFMKFFRKLEVGVNPDVEVNLFLNEKTQYLNCPQIAATINYRHINQEYTLALAQEYIKNEGDALQQLQDILNTIELQKSLDTQHINSIRLLAKRTAELHNALAYEVKQSTFNTEYFNILDQRNLYQTIRTLCLKLSHHISAYHQDMQRTPLHIIPEKKDQIFSFARRILSKPIKGKKIRCHNDFHLGQVLVSNHDYIIIDFEGEPQRQLSERLIKRSPLRDVACMMRSFHYALFSISSDYIKNNISFLHKNLCDIYFDSYINCINSNLLPPIAEDQILLTKIYMMEKALYEIDYEMNNRPDWAYIPCEGLLKLLGDD